MDKTNSRIALNSLALYFRMLIVMGVTLFTSRLILEILGVSDFGLFNVVGGVVLIVGVLNNSLTATTQRFLNFENKNSNIDRLKNIFGTSLKIHIRLAILILFLAETIGLWFLNSYINIDDSRIFAANWVFQFAVLSLVVSILIVPYNASIIAHEKMTIYAYISIVEVLLKLVLIYLLYFIEGDKLIIYSIFSFISTLIVSITYVFYSRNKFVECKSGLKFDRKIYDEMLNFSGWTIFSNLSLLLRTQGLNVLINLFFGTVINATQGIATQINSAVSRFSSSFTQAVNPQIVKKYSEGNKIELIKLVFDSSKLTYFLILFLSLPLLVETEFILNIWLKNIPPYTIVFTRLIIIQSLIESFSSILGTAQGATGNIKKYHIVLSTIGLLNLPITYGFFYFGFEPYIGLIVAIFISIVIGLIRIKFLSISIKLPFSLFLYSVYIKCFVIGLFSSIIPLLFHFNFPDSYYRSISVCLVCFLNVGLLVWFFGLNATQKQFLSQKFKAFLKIQPVK